MIIKKSNLFYFIGLLFFCLLFSISIIKKVQLFTGNEYSEGVYSNGFVYIYKNNKVTEEKYDAITDTKIKNNTEVSFFYNKDTGSAYILNFNRIIRENLFIMMFISIFLILITKNPKE